ncbi:MAG: SAVED domain-containing protein [Flavobacteriales bacterium]|nr:SAVED domain-containing protein [Flavobacteriales bacterium]
MKEIPNGLILIFHEGFAKIDEQKCLDALPNEWVRIPQEKIRLKYSEIIDLGEGYDLNFSQLAFDHRNQYREKIKPILNQYSSYQIVYFGLAHIPLAIDFGSLFDEDRSIEVYNYNRHKGIWFQNLESEENIEDNKINCSNIPSIDQKGIRTALIRLSVSYEIDTADTNDILPNSTEVDIRLEKTGLHAIESIKKMEEIGELIEDIFTKLSENKSDLNEINLFAAVPCGLAFLIGTKISKNNHLHIQTYQFDKNKKPRHKKALLIKKKIEHVQILTSKERTNSTRLRELAHDTLRGDIIRFSNKNKRDSNGRNWPNDVIYYENGLMKSSFWSELPAISKTGIEEDVCKKDVKNVNGGFQRLNREWHIGDYFLTALLKRLKKNTVVEEVDIKIKQAFRQLFFSGILHAKKHNMGDGKHEGIERFSKVLEVADYQADVYSILNEYGFQNMDNSGIENKKDFFTKSIKILIETIWSTDDKGFELNQIAIRRFNRLLIWQWQLILIIASNGCTEEILKILESVPIIELTGLKVREENGDFYYEFKKTSTDQLELAVFYNNEVIRKGSAGNFSLDNLIDGFVKMHTERIQEELVRFIPYSS